MSAAVETYRDDSEATYEVDFGRDREPLKKRARFPEYRRRGAAPSRVGGMHCRRTKRWTWGSGRGARMLAMRAVAGCLAITLASLTSAAFGVQIDWARVGNPGNLANPDTGWGAVSDIFKIAKYETTNEQYAAFLNAVDPTGSNPQGVWTSSMGSNNLGGILFSGTALPGEKYSVKSGAPTGIPLAPGQSYASMPVVFVSWFSAARFANWLHNGMPSNATSMEDGAYTLNGQTTGAIPARNPGATVFLPSRDEWHKAAFFNGQGYNLHATASDPVNTITDISLANAANFGGNATPTRSPGNVGTFANAATYYGVYDMLGNATEWSDTFSFTANGGANGGSAQVFSGSWATQVSQLSLWDSSNGTGEFRIPENFTGQIGFRVAAVPEPSTYALLAAGAAGLGGLEWVKRRRRIAA